MINKLKGAFRNESTPEDTDRRSIDDLSGEETQHAIDYLNLLDRETTTQNIEWAASQHQADDVALATAMETVDERGKLDRRIVAPRVVEDHPTFQVRDDTVSSILTVTSFPREVSLGWLVPLTLVDADYNLSFHIQPRDQTKVRRQLQRRYTQSVTQLTLKQRRGRTDTHEDERDRQDLERILQNVTNGTTTVFDVSIYIEVLGGTKKALDDNLASIQTTLAEQDVDIAHIRHQQLDANGSVAPVCTDTIENTHSIQLEALGTFFNLVEPSIFDPNGVLLGFDDTKRPVILDRYAHSGYSCAMSGKIGSGKSYARMLELYRRLLIDPTTQCVIFDPTGDDYPPFARALGGEVIRFGGGHKVNIMDISPPTADEEDEEDDTYPLTIRSVIEMLRTHFDQRDGLSAAEEGILHQAAHYAYLSKGIILGQYETYQRESPILDDLIRGIHIIAEGGLLDADAEDIISTDDLQHFRNLGILPPEDDDELHEGHLPPEGLPISNMLVTPTGNHQDLAENLQPKFESFKPGGMNHNLNGQTNLDLRSQVVVMDMSSFADTGEMPLILHAMLKWAYLEAGRSPNRFDVTFDEAHYLLGQVTSRELINLFTRHARHLDAGLTLMSQTAHEFVRTPERREVYENCDIKMLFYAESVSEDTEKYFELSEAEKRFVETAARGEDSGYSECLLATSNYGRRRLELRSGPFEHAVLDSDQDPWAWFDDEDRP